LALIDEATAVGAKLLTLDVRVSNRVAQRLYAKYGLEILGRRKRYYTNNGEDALVMTVELLGIAFQARLAQLKATLFSRLSGAVLRPPPIDVCDARPTGRSCAT
jgi:ribosomal-protein-alanine N-acetyltransferase